MRIALAFSLPAHTDQNRVVATARRHSIFVTGIVKVNESTLVLLQETTLKFMHTMAMRTKQPGAFARI